jgi:hypothetical protein
MAQRFYTDSVASSYGTSQCSVRVGRLHEHLLSIVRQVGRLHPPEDAEEAQRDFQYARPMGDTNPRQRPSVTQRFVMRLLRGRASDIERESREWFVVCPNCGLERTYWDIGGVRYKARSRGKRLGLRCPSCGKRSMHAVEHRSGSPAR